MYTLYRSMYKRLDSKKGGVAVIQYYNVHFIMDVCEKDIWMLEQIEAALQNMYMRDIHRWCVDHEVKYITEFKYRWDYPLTANIWNYCTYIRWRFERRIYDKGK